VSDFRAEAAEYLTLRRALGYKLIGQGRLLAGFVDYLEESGAEVITTELALAWSRQPVRSSPLSHHQRLAVVRGFARHCQGLDPRTEIPAADLLPARFNRAVPYLYSPDEITALMEAARAIRHPLRAATYETLVGLLAATGMRVGEATGLDRDDVDLPAGRLLVRCGKNGKSREVAMHPSTTEALGVYARRRDAHCPRPSSPSFFLSIAGTRLDYRSVWHEFDRMRQRARLEDRSRSRPRPPRLHDLRHTFVLQTLLNWYHAGADVASQLPLLSTYLGHVDPVSTYWYFEAAPELLALAAERLDRAWEDLA
jgi:integrase/recombinase XerD